MIYMTGGRWQKAVYQTQVIGTCKYLRDELDSPVTLVAVTGIRRAFAIRRHLRRELERARALPVSRGSWESPANALVLRAFFRGPPEPVISRGVRTTSFALGLRERGHVRSVCYDGRGAVAAEREEYISKRDPEQQRKSEEWERAAVLESDFRLAVSEQLVSYWRERYGYTGDQHAVVPCTLPPGWDPDLTLEATRREETRASLGYAAADVVLAYAGSSVRGWQSLGGQAEVLARWLEARPDLKVFFLAREDPAIEELTRTFPERVRHDFVKQEEVHGILCAADYGLLLREPSTTNAVAAPTKFAEYLSAGLHVLISPGIGDYSGFVERHGCGHVVSPDAFPVEGLSPRSRAERENAVELTKRYFVRSSYRREYERVIEALGARTERV